ncbi:hypothetical protein RhiirA4_483332 [Rhizophagus irregularis]|uniref:Uncharacterized protein n=1 Tax=Rhizophagus irregularis TaxID=588596 RepID=A0A2I1HMG8_9GLOM|nr:hypothetical protein RhiirA4_483332 [Rhizophagus irregularis]
MWCSRIRDPFRKILKENSEILSGNGYITMYGKHYSDTKLAIEITTLRDKEFTIWKYKQFILREEAEMKRLRLELFSQSTSHSEKDKLALISYDYDTHSVSYEAYLSAKATVAKNTMPSVPNFETACISPARQEVISPTPYQSSNYKSNTGELFISSRYAKQPKGTVLRLRDGTKITFV